MQKTKNSFLLKMAFYTLLVLFIAVGCGDGDSTDGDITDGDIEESEMDDDSSELNVIIDGDEDGATEEAKEEEPEIDEEVEYFNPTGAIAFRIIKIEIKIPVRLEIQVPVIDLPLDLREYFKKSMGMQIDSYDINLMLVASKENLADYPYDMTFTTADSQKEEDGVRRYTLTESDSYTLEVRKGNSKEWFKSEKGDISFPISQGMNFELQDGEISGKYTDDGIKKGAIAGVISRKDAKDLVFYQGVTLETIFTSMEMVPDYTFNNGELGYSFIFVYEAEAVELAE